MVNGRKSCCNAQKWPFLEKIRNLESETTIYMTLNGLHVSCNSLREIYP